MKRTIVDENDNIIGVKSRNELDLAKDIYRVSALWLTSSQGDVLVAQRGLKLSNSPGKWAPAVAGTVEEGETYETNIYKEAEEEIGLSGIKFTKKTKVKVSGKRNFFCQYFIATINKAASEFIVHPYEVERVKWVKADSLKEDILTNTDSYVADMARLIPIFL